MKETQRLDKILAHTGMGSRSEIKSLIKRGIVQVNGKTIHDSGQQVHPERDFITVEGVKVNYRAFVYIMLNKPQGVVSATEDLREPTVIDLLNTNLQHLNLFPVGRLDKDTEGLLLLTNDGKLAHNLLSPKKHVEKTYYVEVGECVGPSDQAAFVKGIELDDGYVTMGAKLVILNGGNLAQQQNAQMELTIMEGKFHQVKRMFQSLNKKVVFLKRISMGALQLDESLALGEYRYLTEEELQKLKAGG